MTVSRPRVRRELGRFLKFSVVGTIGAIVDFGVFNLLTAGLRLSSIPASMISFVAAVTSNFLWNRYWTYPDSRSKPLIRQVAQFVLVNLVGLGIRTPIYALTERPMMLLMGSLKSLASSEIPIPLLQLSRNLALAVAVVAVLFWNFVVNRVWTYSDVR